MTQISFITSNQDKYIEMKGFFNDAGLELEWIKERLPEIQTDTLEEVARYALSSYEGENVFIEDAGIFIEALGRFPGVYSRYVYDTIGNQGILTLLDGVENRRAKFTAVIGFQDEKGGHVKLFKGEVKGYVSNSPRGNLGFGYDPIFIPEGYEKTFGEDEKLKSRISHRKRAAEKLIQYLMRT
jgi:XTP/dITP diphosphohydrolase